MFRSSYFKLGLRCREFFLDTVLQTRSTHSANSLRFDGQVAIVTGAGRGLGRQYALLLASRGAKVVVNDFGGSKLGQIAANNANRVADAVVEEISNKNGIATANYESVTCDKSVSRLVEATIKKYGRLDIVINNAGTLRDKSFAKMTTDDFDHICATHLRGSFLLAQASWPIMREQNYGKLIMTSSTSGLYGNFGQANYAAAKMGLIGLTNTLAVEGQRNNIHCNAIVPMAISRLTENIIDEEMAKQLKPDYVAPLVAWLCHKDCETTGGIFEAAGRWFGAYRLQRSGGKFIPNVCSRQDESIELIAGNWDQINKFDEKAKHVESFTDHIGTLAGDLSS